MLPTSVELSTAARLELPMIDTVLHTGSEHPDLLWILVPAFLSFVAGLGVITYADRVRDWITPTESTTSE